MKSNWQTKKLEEVCEVFADGDWIEKKDQSISGIRLIQTGNIGNGYFLDRGEKARYISEETFKRLRCTEVLPGDCLLSRLPDPVGRAGLIPDTGQKMITAVDCTIMRFKKDTLPKWFIYYSLSPDYQKEINKEVTGATRQRISRSNLGNIEISAPPIPEQKRIVKILDGAFEKAAKAKENAEKNLQNVRELFESYLQSIFANPGDGWEEKKLGEVCDLMTGGTPSRNKKEYFIGGEIKWLVSGDVNKKEINACKGRITNEGIKNSNAKYLPINSVIIALNGQGKTRGTVAMLRIKATCNQSLVSIYPKNNRKLLSDYIYHTLNSRYYEIRKITGDSGNDRRGLNMSLIRNIKITYPQSIIEQQSIISKSNTLAIETKKLEAIYQRKLDNLEELKRSILQKTFKGELTGGCS